MSFACWYDCSCIDHCDVKCIDEILIFNFLLKGLWFSNTPIKRTFEFVDANAMVDFLRKMLSNNHRWTINHFLTTHLCRPKHSRNEKAFPRNLGPVWYVSSFSVLVFVTFFSIEVGTLILIWIQDYKKKKIFLYIVLVSQLKSQFKKKDCVWYIVLVFRLNFYHYIIN